MEKDVKTPRWNLSSIFKSFDSEDYKKALNDYISNMDKLDVLLKKAESMDFLADDFAKWLSEFIILSNETGALEESLNAFAYATYSTDTTNSLFLNNLSKLEELSLRTSSQSLRFQQLLTRNKHVFSTLYTGYPQFELYNFVFSELLEDASHKMSSAEEQIAEDLQRTGGAAWGRLHEQVISNLVDSSTGKTFNEIRNLAYSPDRQQRKKAWQTEKTLLKSMEIPIAAALNNLKGATVTLNKRRGWNKAIDKALAASRISSKTLDALIGAIEDSLPMWREYLQLKGKILANSEKDIKETGCAFYDLFAPLPPSAKEEKKDSCSSGIKLEGWTFSQAKEYITQRFSSFSEDMGNFAKKAFEEGWIDAEVRKGKVGGAYCIDFPAHGVSRVLSNFTGTFSDVTTLAHELGHAYHHHCIVGMDYALCHYPMTLAETASIFAETIVMNDAISKATGFDKICLTEMHLQDSCQVLVDILCRFYFEQQVFEERKTGELAAEDFCRIMACAQEKSYGNGLNSERHEYMWAVKTHYYSPDLDFYNFPYAFGLLFALGLYSNYRTQGKTFADVYKSLLKDTGRLSCEDLCRKAGFDIETKEFWALGIKSFEEELVVLKTYEKDLGV